MTIVLVFKVTSETQGVHMGLISNALVVKHNPIRFNLHIKEKCVLCDVEEEALEHLFITCECFHALWRILHSKIRNEQF